MLRFSMFEFINRQFAQCFLKVYWITFFDFNWKINAVDHVIQPNKARRTWENLLPRPWWSSQKSPRMISFYLDLHLLLFIVVNLKWSTFYFTFIMNYHRLCLNKIHVRHFTPVQIPDNADRVSLHGVKQPRDWSQSAHFRSCANNEFIVQ